MSTRRPRACTLSAALLVALACGWDVSVVSGQGQSPAQAATTIATGTRHTCAVTDGGALKCWGWNNRGQLGDGTTTSRWTPTLVSGLESGVVAVAPGWFHTCAVTTAGAVLCWGDNSSAQLGDGTKTDWLTPTQVFGLTSGVVAVATGTYHSCALSTGGGVRCWGGNSTGQLGDGSTTEWGVPVAVSGLGTGVAAIAAGSRHSCALTTDGAVRCWGSSDSGQVDSTSQTRFTPWTVGGMASGVTAITAGSLHTCASRTGGAVLCWGANFHGQLGDGTLTGSLGTGPKPVTGLGSGVARVAAGFEHTCAVKDDGAATCWGRNVEGQLGDGTTTDRWTPSRVVGLTSGVARIAPGVEHTCALTTSGAITCWGGNSEGQLGDGSTPRRLTPTHASGLGSGVAATSAGSIHTCGLTTGGGAICWGDNRQGRLGDGTTVLRSAPTLVSGLAHGVAAISAGTSHTCAVTTGGSALCWGNNHLGKLGDGTATDRWTPTPVSGLGSGVAAISAGGDHTCALTTGGAALCWGNNTLGQLGDGTTTDRSTPALVSGLGSGVAAISASANHTCALTIGGGVSCWGWNDQGALGDGTMTLRRAPTPVMGLGSGVAAIAAGEHHTCALTTGGAMSCWGSNLLGQLGDGTTVTRVSPTSVSGLGNGVTAIAAGTLHTCAVTTSGGVRCWGWNSHGQLGDGTETDRITPTSVSRLGSGAAAVSAGTAHTCALTDRGGVKCWGDDSTGQLGTVFRVFATTPISVYGFGGALSVSSITPNHGGAGGGTAVTIRGAYALEGAMVTIGGVPATDVSVINPAEIVATTPAHAPGTVDVVVQNPDGQQTTLPGGFKYGAIGAPEIAPSDFNGDGITDIAVYRPATGTWYIRNQPAVQFGDPGDVPVAGDYNGDGTTDIAVYRPATGWWFGRALFALQFGDPGDVPVPGDYDGDGTTDVAVYRASTGYWYVRSQFAVHLGGPDYIPVVGDYDGDGRDDVAVYHRVTGIWIVRDQFAAQFGGPGHVPIVGDWNGDSTDDIAVYRLSDGMWLVQNQFAISYGGPGVVPVPRDWNGDGTTDIAVYRSDTGQWFVRDQFIVQYGEEHDRPLLAVPMPIRATSGDFNADGTTDLAVYRPSTGWWYVRNQLAVQFGDAGDIPVPADYDGDGGMDIAVYQPNTGMWIARDQFSLQFGEPDDVPVPGDYNGDGVAEVAVYRPSTGFWYIRNQPGVRFGDTGDIPVPGDYNGDGTTDIAVYRPSTGFWYVRNQFARQFGGPGYVPVLGDYNGDGLTDLAVYHPSSGTWYVVNQFVAQFGDATDVPVPGDYNGDGITDVAVYRQSTGTWYVRNQFGIQFGDSTDVPVVGIGRVP